MARAPRPPRGGVTGPNSNYSAGKAATHGFLYGHAQPSGPGRNALGQFVNTFQGRELNQWLASELQDRVVANLRYRRPTVSTGRLRQVTAASGNTKFGIDYFGVGIPEFLNASQAKYWRTIEEGSKAVWKRPFIGTVLPGMWGGSISGTYENSWGTHPRGAAPFTRAGQASGGKYVTPSQARALGLWAGRGGVVKREIAPMNAYAKAWKDFGAGKRVYEDYVAMLRKASFG